jgi:hypothetical protein
VAGFTVEGDGAVLAQAAEAEPLANETDFGRADRPQRTPQDEQHDDESQDLGEMTGLSEQLH